jgi:superfamily II DNA or RNA helicase
VTHFEKAILILIDLFQSHEWAVSFHPYQCEAIETLLRCHQKGERKLLLVAPPGSGKTLMGLELARRLGQKTVILSPTSMIQFQWIDKFSALSVDLDSIIGFDSKQTIADSRLENDPALLSLTYQAFSIKGKDDELLHPQVEQLFVNLALKGYRTLLLDECHHLMAHWAAAISRFLERVPDAVVVGLTATPPLDRREQEKAVYLSLLGEVDYEVPTPAVIKEGHLAPYQDLVYLVRPTEAESAFVSGAHQALHQVLQALESPLDSLPGLALWAEEKLLEPALLDKSPNLAIALARYLYSLGLYPEGIPWLPEMDAVPGLDDWVEILGCYGLTFLLPQSEPLWHQLQTALEQLGYKLIQGQFRRRRAAIDRVLALSAAKLRAVAQILLAEYLHLGTDLRALVITDFETTAAAGRKAAEGLNDPQAGGALAVMRYLSAQPDLAELHPIMVTGQTLLCAAAFLPVLWAETEAWLNKFQLKVELQKQVCGSFVQIFGAGKDWRSSVYLALVTDMLERGLFHCLIGTRGLMGEGWDCQSLNTLIDLTAVTTFVAVNQIRGRSLRLDPQRPLKVANNWDIIALMPECEGGYRDLERFCHKHERFYGLSDDGLLEKGPGHVHGIFGRLDPRELLLEMETLNQEMLSRVSKRTQAWDLWGVGKPYRSRDTHGVQLRLKVPQLARNSPQQKISNHAERASLQRLPRETLQQAAQVSLKLSQSNRLQTGIRIIEVLLSIALMGVWGFVSVLPWLLVTMLVTETWLDQKNKYLANSKRLAGTDSNSKILESLAQVVIESLKKADQIQTGQAGLRFSQRNDGSLRFWLESSCENDADIFAQAFNEVLAPLQEQRYLLEIELPVFSFQTRFLQTPLLLCKSEEQVALPLPRVLARTRATAQIFADSFAELIGPCHLHYTRQGTGREQMLSYLQQRILPVKVQPMTVWD